VENIIYLSSSDESRGAKIITTTSLGHLGIRELSKLDSACSYFQLSAQSVCISAICASRGTHPFQRARETPEYMKVHCLFIATDSPPTIAAWNAETLEELAVFGGTSEPHKGCITSLCTLQPPADNCKDSTALQTSSSHMLISGGADQSIVVWDMFTATPVQTFAAAHTAEVTAVAAAFLDHDTATPVAVSGSKDTSIAVWDLANGARLASLQGHSDVVTALTIYQSSESAPAAARAPPLLLSGSTDKSVIIWDLTSFLMVRKFESRDSITSLFLHVPNEAALHRVRALAAANAAVAVEPATQDSIEDACEGEPVVTAAVEEEKQTDAGVTPEHRPTESVFQQARALVEAQLLKRPAKTDTAAERKAVVKTEKSTAMRTLRGASRMLSGRPAKAKNSETAVIPPLDKSVAGSPIKGPPSTAPPTPSEHYGENPMVAADPAKKARPASGAAKSMAKSVSDVAHGQPAATPAMAKSPVTAKDAPPPPPARKRASMLPVPTGEHALLIAHSTEKRAATVWDLSTLAALRVVEEVDALCMLPPPAPKKQQRMLAAINDCVSDLWMRITGKSRSFTVTFHVFEFTATVFGLQVMLSHTA
jgi:WD40 repeat protein